jgi:hypothetical protein
MSVSVQFINTGSSANAGNGDSLRTAFTKINGNFLALSTSTGFVLAPATTSTLGGVKAGVGVVIATDGTISSTGSNAGTTINILDQTSAPSVDIISYTGRSILTTGTQLMFTFDKTLYRSATIDISATNEANQTDDVATGYAVTWAGNLATAVGMGPVAFSPDGSLGNAQWDITASALGTDISIKIKNAVGNSAVGNPVTWRAKASLFRL